jgi:hypothetical protein
MSYYSSCNGSILLTYKEEISEKILNFIERNNDAHEDKNHACSDLPEFQSIERYKFFPYFSIEQINDGKDLIIEGPNQDEQLYQLDEYLEVIQGILFSQEIKDSEGIITILGEDSDCATPLRFHKTNGFQEGETTFTFVED